MNVILDEALPQSSFRIFRHRSKSLTTLSVNSYLHHHCKPHAAIFVFCIIIDQFDLF